MMTPGRTKKKPSRTYQTDLVAKGRSPNEMKTTIGEQDLAWGQVEILCSATHKEVL